MQNSFRGIRAIHASLKGKQTSCEDLARQVNEVIREKNPVLNAYLHHDPDQVLDLARKADQRLASGSDLRPLEGVFVGIKDNIHVAGMPTTCASKMLSGFRPVYEATVVERLRQAGAIITGKLNCDEFAMGSSNENSAFGPVRNPLHLDLVPGGSSGGSAAAVAAGMCTVALGSDTGGSIRQPAAFCSVVGLKPTYGTVSRRGLVAFASSFDQVGPLANDVFDAALIHEVISGKDSQDATSLAIAPQKVEDWTRYQSLKGLRVGVVRELSGSGIDPLVQKGMSQALQSLKSAGAEIVDISLSLVDHCLSVYYILSSAEASSNLARYDSVRYGPRYHEGKNLEDLYIQNRSQGFGPEVKRRIILGTYVLSEGYYDAYYLKAQKVRTLIRREFEQAFSRCDFILTPTSPIPPFQIGSKTGDPMQMYLADICTIPVSIAGLPAISIPVPAQPDELPVGLQLIAPALADVNLLSFSARLEELLRGVQ